MADVKFDDFLLQYFMQMRFNEMPPEVRAKFDDYSRSDDFRGHMKEWKKHLINSDGSKKGQPDPNGPDYHLTEEQWKNLFLEFQSSFRNMAENRKNFTNSVDFSINNQKIIDFLDEYFGYGKLFDKATASPTAEAQIKILAQLLENNASILKIKLEQEWNLVDSTFTYDKLLKGIKDKKYNTDSEFQNKLTNLAYYITSYTKNPYYADQNLINAIGVHDFEEIQRGFDDKTVDPAKLTNFKQEYDILLRRLYHDDKIRDAFPSDKVKTAYNKAKENVAYDDQNSKDYIPPKRDDELTLPQHISQWVGDTYADTLDKYIKFKGDRLYFSPQAKQIIGAIHKAKLKPTDGLGKVLEKAADIKKGLLYKSPKATEHFEWFEKTFNTLKGMDKAFEGALRNGRQLKALVSEMILIAVRDNKIDQAKTAMEILSVIKYGYTTSKVMDALGKENLTIFSDGKLSWNKNEGMKFVTNALDKSIKTAFMGIGYGVTMVGNSIRLSGSKFNGKRGRLKNAQEQWAQNAPVEKAAQQQLTNRLNTQNTNDINAKRQEQHALNQNLAAGQNAINNINDYNQQKSALDAARAQEKSDKDALKQREQDPAYVASQQRVNKYNDLIGEQATYNQQLPGLQNNLQNIDNQIMAIQQIPNMTQAEKDIRTQSLLQQKINIEQQIQEATQRLQDIPNEIAQITSNPNWANDQATVAQFEQDKQALDNRVQQNDNQQSRLSQWNAAEENIKELTKQINNRNEVMRTWDDAHRDRYQELMAYWDMLESGRDTHTGKMYNWFSHISAKKAQQDFDVNKAAYISDYLRNYSYAA